MANPIGSLVWTALPNRIEQGKIKLSVIVTPKLYGPENETQSVRNFVLFLDWPRYAAGMKFTVLIDDLLGKVLELKDISPVAYQPKITGLWSKLFDPALPVQCFPSPSTTVNLASVKPEPVVITYRTAILDKYIRDLVSAEMYGALSYPGLEAKQLSAMPSFAASEFRFSMPDLDTSSKSMAATFANVSDKLFEETDSQAYIDQNGRRFAKFTGLRSAAGEAEQLKAASTSKIAPSDDGRVFTLTEAGELELPPGAQVNAGFMVSVESQISLKDAKAGAEIRVTAPPPEMVAGQPAIAIPRQAIWVFRFTGDHWEAFNANRPEFHALVSALGGYPDLSRQLQLTFDLEIPEALVPSLPGAGRVRVLAQGAGFGDVWHLFSPWTRFLANEVVLSRGLRSFAPMPLPAGERSPPIQTERVTAGLLELGSSRVLSYDFLGGFTKIYLHKIAGIDRLGARPEISGNPLFGPSERLPSLRSVGMALTVDRVFTGFKEAIKRTNAFETKLSGAVNALADSTDVDVYAEDVIAGYRIDVRNAGATWRSLCERQVNFAVGSTGNEERWSADVDEGWVSFGSDRVRDDEGRYLERLLEDLFHWKGWSLVAPRPALPLGDNGGFSETSNVNAAFPFQAQIKVPKGSLPKLVLGETYEFRARTVDLAGHGWTTHDANDVLEIGASPSATSPPEAYLRHDPVEAPVLVAMQKPGVGDKGDYLVIRSTGEDYERRNWLVVPPKISQDLAIQHGMLNGLKDPKRSWKVLIDHDGDLPGGDIQPTEADFLEARSGLLRTPYLPDPCALNAAFLYLPGFERKPSDAPGAGTPMLVPFDVDPDGPVRGKPYSQPFRLRVTAGRRASVFDKQRRRLTISLPAGEECLVVLSSSTSAHSLDLFGAWQWTKAADDLFNDRVAPAKLSDLAAGPASGQNWLVTPSREIRIVNATAQPVLRPSFGVPVIDQRPYNSRAVHLTDAQTKVHRLSTSKLEVFAVWDETVDIPGTSNWGKSSFSRRAFEFVIKRPDLTIAPSAATHLQDQLDGIHEFEDTKHRTIRYYLNAITQFAEYFPPGVTSDIAKISRKSDLSAPLRVPSSAPPSLPLIKYILPTFGWTDNRATGFDTRQRARIGGSLRIYLERPWFSSGDGEMLAVVLAPKDTNGGANTTALPVELSSWGIDPISDAPALPGRLDAEHFIEGAIHRAIQRPVSSSNFASIANGLVQTARSPNSANVYSPDIVAFDVGLDAEKDMVFADIKLDTGTAYYPFIRLALARFQPDSIKFTHLSEIALADYIQMAPDRTMSVSYFRKDLPGIGNRRHLRLSITGPGPGASDGSSPPNVIEVALEEFGRDNQSVDSWSRPSAEPASIEPELVEGVWVWKIELPIYRDGIELRRRLVIAEYEERLSDADFEDRIDPMKAERRRRVVFTDTIELPPIHFY